jgi:hypothetical protein
MPAKPTWLLRLPEIIATLSAMDVPVIDRATCEQLFSVRRRRAVELMQSFGGYQVGHTLLADRVRLIQQLQALDTEPNVLHERRRKQTITAELDRLRRVSVGAAVRIEVPRSTEPSENSALPSGVSISAGKLIIEFVRVEELFSRLYALAQAAAADYETFCRAVQTEQASPEVGQCAPAGKGLHQSGLHQFGC